MSRGPVLKKCRAGLKCGSGPTYAPRRPGRLLPLQWPHGSSTARLYEPATDESKHQSESMQMHFRSQTPLAPKKKKARGNGVLLCTGRGSPPPLHRVPAAHASPGRHFYAFDGGERFKDGSSDRAKAAGGLRGGGCHQHAGGPEITPTSSQDTAKIAAVQRRGAGTPIASPRAFVWFTRSLQGRLLF